jgi:hypothetical protein
MCLCSGGKNRLTAPVLVSVPAWCWLLQLAECWWPRTQLAKSSDPLKLTTVAARTRTAHRGALLARTAVIVQHDCRPESRVRAAERLTREACILKTLREPDGPEGIAGVETSHHIAQQLAVHTCNLARSDPLNQALKLLRGGIA